MVMGLDSGWLCPIILIPSLSWLRTHPQPRWMLARGILGSGRKAGSVSSRPFPNSFGWWWLISSVFLIRISCHKTTHANGYYGAWPGWAVSISVLPLTFSVSHWDLPKYLGVEPFQPLILLLCPNIFTIILHINVMSTSIL